MLEGWLTEHRADIVSDWFERIISGYPAETSKFLSGQQDPFANPVGAGLRDELGPLFDGLLEGGDDEDPVPSLDRIIRVRAVQDLSPSEAVGFVSELKALVRERVEAAGVAGGHELAALDEKIDRLQLLAFDVYVNCREQMYSIRIKEIRNRSLKQMERLNEWRARRDASGDLDAVDPH